MKNTVRNPHTFVSPVFEPRTIAIIGGQGNMGRRLADEFIADGYSVRVTGAEPLRDIGPTGPKEWKRALRRWNEHICAKAEVVVFSVPIPLLNDQDGLSRIFGHTPPRGWRDKLVLDICSTKTGPTRALAELRGATVIGTHPMFGPTVKSLDGQTVFVSPVPPQNGNRILRARLEVRLRWLRKFWESRGVSVVEIDPEEHDAFVPSVQFGVLLSVLLYGEGLQNSHAQMGRVLAQGTPNSRALCARLARMISPAILPTYVNVAFDNPHNLKWIDSAISTLDQMKRWLMTGNRTALMAWLTRLAAHQPQEFRAHFTEMSVTVDEFLSKREFVAACLAREDEISRFLSKSTDQAVLTGMMDSPAA